METVASSLNADLSDAVFGRWLENIDRRLENLGTAPLFTTDVNASQIYLDSIPADYRQYHNCHACKNFLNRYGSLVTLDQYGTVIPALWHINDTPDFYHPVVFALYEKLSQASITGVFLTKEPKWGVRATGKWTHLSVVPPKHRIYGNCMKSAFEGMAEKLEDHKNIRRALNEFPIPTLQQAMHLMNSEALYRAEKISGPLKWLLALAEAVNSSQSRRAKDNLIWRAVATAPPGFCHPRSSVMGSLLEDLLGGMAFDMAAKRFADKMRPDRYQRPVAPPSDGAILRAEKIFETMGLAPALRRRFAKPEDITVLAWKPPASVLTPTERKAGIFDHLRKPEPKADDGRVAPITTMTWVKFVDKILPDARELFALIPAYGPFAAFVTAADPSAPPILQWDSPERRNQVSFYTYLFPTPHRQWGLPSEAWSPVWGISNHPAHWAGGHEHQGKVAFLLLPDARDSGEGGLALFPENIRSELHEVRAVIEAHSKRSKLEPVDGPVAAGLMLSNRQGKKDIVLRVRSALGTADYRIDRWD